MIDVTCTSSVRYKFWTCIINCGKVSHSLCNICINMMCDWCGFKKKKDRFKLVQYFLLPKNVQLISYSNISKTQLGGEWSEFLPRRNVETICWNKYVQLIHKVCNAKDSCQLLIVSCPCEFFVSLVIFLK